VSATLKDMTGLEELLQAQASMVARRQLNGLGIDSDRVSAHVRAGRWVVRTPRVISAITGELTWEQRCWLSVLHAGPRSMLGGLTAAAAHGLQGWPRAAITVLVDDELAFEPIENVRFFRSRRSLELLRSRRPGIPSAQLEPALLLWAGYDAPVRAAHGALAAAVQQRLTTAERLLEWVARLRPLRRARQFQRTLADIAGGVQSGAELDVRRMCRRHGLVPPDRQRGRVDRSGRRRWTDCEWDLTTGAALVLEVDGSFHMDVVQWAADLKRTRSIVTRERILVRCTAFELRHEQDDVARDLIALGVPRR
jgi:hypothetical protein